MRLEANGSCCRRWHNVGMTRTAQLRPAAQALAVLGTVAWAGVAWAGPGCALAIGGGKLTSTNLIGVTVLEKRHAYFPSRVLGIDC